MAKNSQAATKTPTVPAPERESKKTVCPITRKQFLDNAKQMSVVIDGQSKVVSPKQFSTGSLGWNLSDKIDVVIDGKVCKVQVGLNLTIVGSKELPDANA